jgi:hypothetical protein
MTGNRVLLIPTLAAPAPAAAELEVLSGPPSVTERRIFKV